MSDMIKDANFKRLVESYSQIRYDFNPESLSGKEVLDIRNLAREKRADYGIAPIGEGIFKYISSKEKDLYFDSYPFKNKELDGILYVPASSRDITFIILNSEQALLNQIFATAHEYYHFLTDIERIRKNPHICSLSELDGKFEQKASRFAAEFLLPIEALSQEIEKLLATTKLNKVENMKQDDITGLCYFLTVKYSLPLKAILYRLYEEKFISLKMFDNLLENYSFLKDTFTKANNIYRGEVSRLLANDNSNIHEIMYEIIPKAFNSGYVSLDRLHQDAEILGLDVDRFGLEVDAEEDDDLDALQKVLRNKMDANGEG